MLLTMMASTGTMWGQTRSEASLVALTFPDDNSANNGLTSNQYTSTWTASIGDYEWSISNFNNNNWTNWTYIKCGRKNNASVATIISSEAYTEPISRVAITIDNITASKINSIKLYTSSNGSNWSASGEFTKATGTQSVALSDPTANLYYKIEFDCASGSSNGLLTVSKVEYFYNEGNPVVVTPIISPDGGPFYETLEVSISCATDGATIYYTTDGNAPTTSSTVYSNPFTIDANTTVNAYAVLENYDDSEVATAEFTKVSPMSVAEAIAAIDATQNLPIASQCVTGIVCTASSNIYSGKLSYWISDDGTANNSLEAYNGFGLYGESFTAVDDVQVGDVVVIYGNLTKYSNTYEFAAGNYLLSLVRPAVTVASPSFSPAAGTYAEAQTVTMSCTTDGAAIHYTTDGTEPDGNSNVYSTGITVSETTTFKAKAIKGDDASNVVTATYHICSADNPYTVAQALEFHAYPTSTIWVHGIVSAAPTAAPNSDGQLTYYISDNGEATNQLQVYKGKGLNNAAFTDQDDIQVGDIVTITGTVKIYNTTTEFDAGNYLTSFERPTPTVPTITVNQATVNATAAETEGTLLVTYTNITTVVADVYFCDANGNAATYDWIEAEINDNDNVDYVIGTNTGTARTAYFKVWAYADDATTEVYSNIVTINQEEGTTPPTPGQYDWVLTDWEDLTADDVFVIVGDNGDTYAMSNNNGTGSAPSAVEVSVTNGTLSGTIEETIQWNLSISDNGYTFYPNGTTITWLYCTNTNNGVRVGTGDAKHFTFDDTFGYLTTTETTDQRYIGIYQSQDWRCYKLDNNQIQSNIANQTFAFYKRVPVSTEPSITINPGPYNMNCDGGHAVLDVSYANMAQDPQLEVIFYESDGTTAATYNHDWIDAHIDNDGNLDGTIQLNTSNEARSAYFKIKGVGNNSELVYSDLVTINQAAYALNIVFETTELNIEVGGESDRKISFDYSGLGSNPSFVVNCYESDGTTSATYDWLTTSINKNKVNITVAANTGAARHAYFKVYGSGSIANTESNLVTINQAEYVAPTYTVTYNANGGTGTMTDPNSPYTENTEVTLLENTFGAPEGKIWDSWLVKDANQTTIEVNEGKFNMPASNVTVTAQWIDNPIVPTYEWVLTALEDITSSDVFVIIGNNGSTYAMTNDNGTVSAPATSSVTIANNKLSDAPADNLKWNVEVTTNGYTFYPNGITNKWLYCTDTNNGLRVGTGDKKVFGYEEVTTTNKEGYYLTITPASDKRYVCIYNNADWRSYKSGSIVKTDTKFYKRQEASTDPQLYTDDVNIESDATEGAITYTLENPVSGGELTAEITDGNEGNWLTLGTIGENIPFTCSANTEATSRTATVTLTYTYDAKTSITATAVVTQAALIIDYAELPFDFDGGKNDIESTTGLTQEGLGNDYSSTANLRFDDTGDYLILHLNAAPASLSYDIKGNSFSGGTYKVQTSADGVNYSDLATYTELAAVVQSVTLIDLDANVRYIKWIYTNKSTGNVGLGNIHATEHYDTYGDVTFSNLDLTTSSQSLIIHDGSVVTVTGTLTNNSPDNILIEEGGQLIHTDDVAATVQKNITAYTAKDGDGWYLIATPVETIDKSVVAGTTYDLFLYSEPDAMWYAHWDNPGFQTLNRGQGYLYANAEDKTINYAGTMKATNANINIDLDYTSTLSDAVRGFNLVGNPFTRNLVLGDMKLGGANLTTYYVTNTDRTALQAITSDAYQIKPGEGFFVQATAASQQLSFNASSKDDIDFRYIKIVAGNENGYDNAYIQMGDCNTLRKMNIANKTEVYVMDGEDDYAAARVEELAGSMPVHFKAIADGEYTITIEAKYTDVYYMHLFDNFTGEDIDLMLEPSYTFHAAAEDAENRFLLVFDFNNHLSVNEYYTNDVFAYQYGDEIIINGEGELQIFDVMGRMVLNTKVNGVQSYNVPSNGVYILRIIGNDIKTQKIVVK